MFVELLFVIHTEAIQVGWDLRVFSFFFFFEKPFFWTIVEKKNFRTRRGFLQQFSLGVVRFSVDDTHSGGRVPRFLRLSSQAIWEEERESERERKGERREGRGKGSSSFHQKHRVRLLFLPHFIEEGHYSRRLTGTPFFPTLTTPHQRSSRCRRRRRTLGYAVACSRQWYRRKRGERLGPLYNSRRGRRYQGEINIINNIVKKIQPAAPATVTLALPRNVSLASW